jgi:hypothetical protein
MLTTSNLSNPTPTYCNSHGIYNMDHFARKTLLIEASIGYICKVTQPIENII